MKKRLVIRILVFLIAVVFALQVLPLLDVELPLRKTASVIPALSPFAALCSVIALRSAGIVSLLAIPVLLLSLRRPRWFCTRACPMGLVTEMAGKLHPGAKKKFSKWPKLGPWIAMLGIGGALAGYPLFIWLDPLCIFNGFFSALRVPFVVASAGFLSAFIVIVVMSIIRPNLWCWRLCPLGGVQDVLGSIGRLAIRKAKDAEGLVLGRRAFLGLGVGAAAGYACRTLLPLRGKKHPIRPPGSAEESKMGAVCERCGNCVRACPTQIIQPDLGKNGIGNFMTPVIRIGHDPDGLDGTPQYCLEYCNECNKVCPTNAIAHLKMEAKEKMRIGTAVVTKKKCIAWEYGGYCMVCDEFCPYKAIDAVKHDGVNCPKVDPAICRGCGMCETQCPADEVAIVIQGTAQASASQS